MIEQGTKNQFCSNCSFARVENAKMDKLAVKGCRVLTPALQDQKVAAGFCGEAKISLLVPPNRSVDQQVVFSRKGEGVYAQTPFGVIDVTAHNLHDAPQQFAVAHK